MKIKYVALVLLIIGIIIVFVEIKYEIVNLAPDSHPASRCTLPAGIACTDFRINSATSTVEIILRNGMGFDLTSMTISISECPSLTGQSLTNGTQKIYALTGCKGLVAGERVNIQLNITYTNSITGLTNKTQGSIIARAE